jgi:hypothetical protein
MPIWFLSLNHCRRGAGTYLGLAGDLARAMASTNYTIAEDDQRFWTTVYFKSRADADLPRIVLDHESDVFLCMSGRSVWRDVSFDPSARRYKYNGTPGWPVVIHFNNAKADIGPFFRVLQGAWCPYDAWSVCGVASWALPAAAAFLAALGVARAALWVLVLGASTVLGGGGALGAVVRLLRRAAGVEGLLNGVGGGGAATAAGMRADGVGPHALRPVK